MVGLAETLFLVADSCVLVLDLAVGRGRSSVSSLHTRHYSHHEAPFRGPIIVG